MFHLQPPFYVWQVGPSKKYAFMPNTKEYVCESYFKHLIQYKDCFFIDFMIDRESVYLNKEYYYDLN